MPLVIPSYIDESRLSASPVRHKWSQGDAMTALGGDNPTVEKKLGLISFRAHLGLSAAIAEWMRVRFAQTNEDAELGFLICAVWCASIDFRYLRLEALQFAPVDDNDPVLGPQREAKRLLRDNCEIYLEVDIGVVRYTRAFANLVSYVLPQPKLFQNWFKAIVTRLPGLSGPSASTSSKIELARTKAPPRGVANDIWGEPLPREAFDPSTEIDPEKRAAMIDALLGQMFTTTNPFLRSPDELRALGLTGTPYRYPTS